MLHLITGTPGAKKTAFTVSKLDKIESSNKVNLVKNKKYFEHNKALVDKYKDDFTYIESEVGSGHDLKNQIDILDDDYFDIFAQDFDDLRPDDYFLRSVQYNQICGRINQREGVQGFKGLLPVRTIYTNIKALKIDYVRSLSLLVDDDGKVDWRLAPDGSIIVIDEVQLVAPFDDIKTKNEPIVQDLTIHRHRGFDFYFITQFPSLLHQTVKVLIGVHYHLTVPYGHKTKVYQYGSTRDRPDTASNKLSCETKFGFSPPDRIFKLYKSTTINTHKRRLPVKMLAIFAFFILGSLAVFGYGLRGAGKSSLIDHDKELVAGDAGVEAEAVDAGVEVEAVDAGVEAEAVDVEADELFRPAMIIASSVSCRAYNSDGQILDISDQDCFDYSDNPATIPVSAVSHDMTYDYFASANASADDVVLPDL